MGLTKKENHAEEAQARQVEQFKEKPDLAAIIDAASDQTQDDEDVFFELLDERALDVAVGVQLDGLGEIVGEDRLGRSDDDYRLGIRAQIKKNVSSGTGDEILEIVALLTSNTHELVEFFPAGLALIFDDALPEDPVQLAANLPVAAGVRGTVQYTLQDDDDTFTFASGDTPETSSTQGFSNDGGTSGGAYSDAELI
jgi:hypothetical protein